MQPSLSDSEKPDANKGAKEAINRSPTLFRDFITRVHSDESPTYILVAYTSASSARM